MKLSFWGVRGSIPVPGPGTVRYGGNTSCLAIEAEDMPLLVFDAGTGIRMLGEQLPGSAARGVELVLTHTHWDHIQGLGFFTPLYQAPARLGITGPSQAPGLRTVLERLTAWENFPIPPARWVGLRDIREIGPGPTDTGGWQLRAIRLNHPGHTLGYRVDHPGMETVAYLSDNELGPFDHGLHSGWRRDLVDFLAGVGTVIHDTTWRDDQVAAHAGWGHSGTGQAVELALEAGCRRLVLFHHAPQHDDGVMDGILAEARRAAGTAGGRLEVTAAVEGGSLMLDQED